MLPSIHDHTLLGYRVSLEYSEIALRTVPDQRASSEPVSAREIIFEGCVGHHFEHIADGSILGWLLELPLEKFVAEHAAQFEQGNRESGWLAWWNGSVEEAVSYLRQHNLHAFEITSSYGMYGWVLARSVRASDWEQTTG